MILLYIYEGEMRFRASVIAMALLRQHRRLIPILCLVR